MGLLSVLSALAGSRRKASLAHPRRRDCEIQGRTAQRIEATHGPHPLCVLPRTETRRICLLHSTFAHKRFYTPLCCDDALYRGYSRGNVVPRLEIINGVVFLIARVLGVGIPGGWGTLAEVLWLGLLRSIVQLGEHLVGTGLRPAGGSVGEEGRAGLVNGSRAARLDGLVRGGCRCMSRGLRESDYRVSRRFLLLWDWGGIGGPRRGFRGRWCGLFVRAGRGL